MEHPGKIPLPLPSGFSFTLDQITDVCSATLVRTELPGEGPDLLWPKASFPVMDGKGLGKFWCVLSSQGWEGSGMRLMTYQGTMCWGQP